MNRIILLLTILLTPLSILRAEGERVYLGRMDLAGLPPANHPPIGQHLSLDPSEHALTTPDGPVAGYVPAVFQSHIAAMCAENIELTFEVRHRYARPAPGKFLSVDVWAETGDEYRVRPLMYKVRSLPADRVTTCLD